MTLHYVWSRVSIRAAAAAVLLTAVVVVLLAAVVGGSGASAPALSASRALGLPAGLQAVAQRTMGASDRGFWVHVDDSVLAASGGGIASTFGRSGVRLNVPAGTLELRLARAEDESLSVAVTAATPIATGNVVRYRSGPVVEWYRNGPFGLEQGFTVRRAAQGDSGELVLALRVGGSLHARRSGSQVLFSTRTGTVALRYGQLSAQDATARQLPASIELRGRTIFLRVDDRGARYPLRIDPFIQQGAPITDTEADTDAELGASVALSADGNTALIGAANDSDGSGGSQDGAAFVFTRSGSSWTQVAKLVDNGGSPDSGAEFGTSVALSADGTIALIGAPLDSFTAAAPNTSSFDQGAAWVFTASGTTWSQQAKLISGDPGNDDGFGTSVALSADGAAALIGAPDDRDGTASSPDGSVSVFTGSGSSWTQQTELVDNPGGTPDIAAHFGASAALSANGNTALIGGPNDASLLGAAWVFTGSGSSWTQQAKLVDSTADSDARFGASVALSADGGTALIGGPSENTDNGAAWVFTGSGSSWTQRAKLVETSDAGGAFSGGSVALSANGNTALIGGPNDKSELGAAWVFTGSGSSWTQQAVLTDSTADTDAAFGTGVALSASGGTAMMGAPFDNNLGAAYAFVTPVISSAPNISFGSQTTGQPGSVLWLTVQNSGQAPLAFTGPAEISGTDAGEFTIPSGDDLCDDQALAAQQDCWIGVQFTAASAGAQGPATLSFGADNAYPTGTTVTLTGTGVAPNSGPTGAAGPAGPAGAGRAGRPGRGLPARPPRRVGPVRPARPGRWAQAARLVRTARTGRTAPTDRWSS
jgi:hypothetical protein